MASDVEDDYLSMTIAEPAKSGTTKETSLQRTARLKREAAERARIPSKAELAAKEEAARNVGFATKLDASTNKGALLMAKMGFKGGALGATGNEGRENPIEVMLKGDRGGIGMDSEKKRKLREVGEAQDAAAKKVKLTEAEYRERNRLEAEDKRAEGQWYGAMKVLEGLEEDDSKEEQMNDTTKTTRQPLRSIKLLYRPLVKSRRERDQKKLDMKLLYQDLSSKGAYGEPDMDDDDKLALGEVEDVDTSEEDLELEAYEALPPVERLNKVIEHMRMAFHYCFWCKYRYPDAAMDGCPGTTEDEHG